MKANKRASRSRAFNEQLAANEVAMAEALAIVMELLSLETGSTPDDGRTRASPERAAGARALAVK